MRIGILEDDPAHASQLTSILTPAGHGCSVYQSGSQFLYALAHESFDLLILDWMVPDTSGISILERIRERSHVLPVLFVTGRDAEEDIVTALRNGADDYLVKPPRAGELLARIEALRRRAEGGAMSDVVSAPPYRLDTAAGEAWLADERIALTSRQFDLALFLFRQPGQLFSRTHLLESIWGVGNQIQTRTLDIHISQLRNLLRLTPQNGWRISSVYGHGYRLERCDD